MGTNECDTRSTAARGKRRAPCYDERRDDWLHRTRADGSLGECAPNRHSTLELVARLKDLRTKIARKPGASLEHVIDCRERACGALAIESGAHPVAEEKNAAIPLDPRETVERGNEISPGEVVVRGIVKCAQARRDPVLIEFLVGEVTSPVARLDGGIWMCGTGDECAAPSLASGISSQLGSEARLGRGGLARNERRYDRPTCRRPERGTGSDAAVEQGIEPFESGRRLRQSNVRVEMILARSIRT